MLFSIRDYTKRDCVVSAMIEFLNLAPRSGSAGHCSPAYFSFTYQMALQIGFTDTHALYIQYSYISIHVYMYIYVHKHLIQPGMIYA